jgi:uncharacterized membrane protein YfcA
MILTLLLSSLIGLSLGLLGGGGTMLTVPVLLYTAGLDPKEAIATSLLVVGLSSAVGAFQQRRDLELRTGLSFGAAAMAGAYASGRLAELLPSQVVLALFTAMMVLTAVMMLRSSRQIDPPIRAQPRSLAPILIEGVVVGLVTGIVGAGGGFLVVPALVLLGGLPMKRAVATSLFIVSAKSFAGFAGYLGHVAIELDLALSVAGVAMIGAFSGSLLSAKLSGVRLKQSFALLILAVAPFLLSGLRNW